MTKLIIPSHIAAQHRPYAEAITYDLLQELKLRSVLHEITAQGIMPAPADIEAQKLTTQQLEVLRTEGFKALFAQVGPALSTSDLVFTGTGFQPPDKREVLVIKVLVVRHPLRPTAEPKRKGPVPYPAEHWDLK